MTNTNEKNIPILYTIDCPKCKVLEKKLESKGISYEKINNVDLINKKGLENAEFPILEIDNQLMKFSEAVNWVNTQNK